MKEFGYEVSRDYEKLWRLVSEKKRIICFVDYINGSRSLGCYTKYHEKDGCHLHWSGKCGMADVSNSKKEFLADCNRLNLTFIDPEPEDENAIYYADGSMVEEGDTVQCDDSLFSNGIAKLYPAQWGAQSEDGFSPFDMDCDVTWDGNRMINVTKVTDG